jgi:hypothetical protein
MKRGRGKAQSALWAVLVSLCVLVCLFVCADGSALGAVSHAYLPQVSEELAKGVPAGCSVKPPPLAEPPCIKGALAGSSALTVDGKNLWVADAVEGQVRVDRFNDETGAFAGPQLNEAEGVSRLGGTLAVGHAFSGEQVYTEVAGGMAVFNGVSGKLLGKWTGKHTKNEGFRGSGIGVAVDTSASFSDEHKGDVYVAAPSAGEPVPKVVDVFDPAKAKEAGEEPVEVVAELEGTCEKPGEALPCAGSKLLPFHEPRRVAVSPLNGDVLVADGTPAECSHGFQECVVDVFEPVPGMPKVYTFLFAIKEANGVPFRDIVGLAVDGNGDIYVAEGNSGGSITPNVVDQFNSESVYLGRLTRTPSHSFMEVGAVAVDPASGGVFVGDPSIGLPVKAFGKSVVIPDVAVAPASAVHARHVVLNGTVKLDKAGPAQCFFDYGTTKAYGKTVPCKPATVTEAEGEPAAVSAEVGGLEPDTTYFYRVRAVNSSGVPSAGEGAADEGAVTTPGPGLHGEFSSEVAATAATLDAAIDPHGSNTSYYFQYVDPAGEGTPSTEVCRPTGLASCRGLPAPPGEALGSTPGDQHLSQRLQSLSPNTTYHYRVVVVSEPEAGKSEEYAEQDKSLTTQPAPAGFSLPDGRQWELVSPPDKHGALLLQIWKAWVIQSSRSGDAFTDLASTPTEEGAPGYFDHEQILSTRGQTGWSSQNISLPHHEPAQLSVGEGQEYRFFSEDLSLGLAESFGEFTSLKPFVFPPDSERTPYIRHDLTCPSAPGSCFEPLVTGAPGYANVPEGTTFGGNPTTDTGVVRFVGGTPDLRHVLVSSGSGAPLKAGAPAGALYEWSAGKPASEQLALVSVLPEAEGGTPVEGELGGPTDIKSFTGSARWAVSRDGSRVVWSGKPGLYLTDMNSGKSVRLDVVQPGASGGAEVDPQFQLADSEGSRVFFSDPQQLVRGATAGRAGDRAGDLYECEITVEASGPKCSLRDVAPGAVILGGVLGASEDGTYVYFASNNVVGDGGERGAVPGGCKGLYDNTTRGEYDAVGSASCNLYMVHYDAGARSWEAPVFIGALSGQDSRDWSPFVYGQTARVSPRGGWLAFMSDRSLTGYDNHDARSGKPDHEVFVFGAASRTLACASCNPTGARPAGVEVGERVTLVFSTNVWAEAAWIAASIPGWTPFEDAKARYQSRYLSDEGRLFFNSSDALVPQDVNNQEDVYQWEPAGVGGCTASLSTYSPASGGCVGLISSGTSHQESGFLDASESGNDVFFLTTDRLVPQDTDTALDVYDAHVCSVASPCPAPPASLQPCTTADACRAAAPPQPQIFGAPASSTFSGPGNLAPVPPTSGRSAEQVRIAKLGKALKACAKKRDRRKRAACEKRARKLYGKASKAKRAKRAGRGSSR